MRFSCILRFPSAKEHIFVAGGHFDPLGHPGDECEESASHHIFLATGDFKSAPKKTAWPFLTRFSEFSIVFKDGNNGKHLIKPESDDHMKNQKNRPFVAIFTKISLRLGKIFVFNFGNDFFGISSQYS